MKYSITKLYVRRKKNLLKIMLGQSHNEKNIEYYRPKRILRSNAKVKLKSKFTRITKIQKGSYYRGTNLWNSLPRKVQCEYSKICFKNAVNRLGIK